MNTKQCSLIFVICLAWSSLFAQNNLFENPVVTPASCGTANGEIRPEAPFYVDPEWEDGSTELNRDGLLPGVYTLTGTDEKGCTESLVFEVPEISCDLKVRYTYPTDGPSGPSTPCVIVHFDFYVNGQVIDTDYLSIYWIVTVPLKYFPYSYTYYSYEPTLPIYSNGASVELFVSLKDYRIPCCSFNEKLFLSNPCGQILVKDPPRVFVSKSTFSDEASGPQVPGLVDLLVYGDGVCGETTDLRGYIIDDNNGELIYSDQTNFTDGSALNVSPGYLRFSNDLNWAAVPNGSIITVYDPSHSLNNFVALLDDPTDVNNDYHYVLSAENSSYFRGMTSGWNINDQLATYTSTLIAPSWELVRPGGGAGAMQVRYPDGEYCHGISFGKTNVSSEENLFPLYITETEHGYCQIHMRELSYEDKTAFDVLEVYGGFTPGQAESPALAAAVNHLRNCTDWDSTTVVTLPLQVKPNDQIGMSNQRKMEAKKNTTLTSSLELSPNPFTQYLDVKFQSEVTGSGSIQVFNTQGKLIHTLKVESSEEPQIERIDFGQESAGLYLIKFLTPDNQIISKKAVMISTD